MWSCACGMVREPTPRECASSRARAARASPSLLAVRGARRGRYYLVFCITAPHIHLETCRLQDTASHARKDAQRHSTHTIRTDVDERLSLRPTRQSRDARHPRTNTGKHAKKERFAHSRRIRPSAAGEVQGATGRAAKDAGGIAAIAVSVLVASTAECKVSAGLHHCVAMLSEHTTHTPSRSATPTLVLAGKRSDHRLLLLLIWKVITPPEQRRLGPAPLAGASSR